MYIVKNAKTGKPVKNAISCKPFLFESKADAEYMASSCERDSVLNATAFNSIRPSKFVVCEVE